MPQSKSLKIYIIQRINHREFLLWGLFTFWILGGAKIHPLFAAEKAEAPIIINGDTVDYATESKEVVVTGNAVVEYGKMRLTAEKLILNTETKDAKAVGNARLDEPEGTVEGSELIYNFQTKQGIIMDSDFRSNPYFGRAEKTQKVSEDEFVAKWGYMTTCSYDRPHWRIKSKKINFFPGDKVKTKDDFFYVGKIPLLYVPQYNHSLRDPMMHVQFLPGKSRDWGLYLLSAWRYNLTEDLQGRIYLDYRSLKGMGEGFGINYTSSEYGKGDYKFYYTQERDHALTKENRNPRIFQRYLIRWRHKWMIDPRSNFTAEYYKITDSKRAVQGKKYNFLKDYFFREYEKDTQPLSYALYHQSFQYSSFDFLMQKRVNRWYSQEEKLPEIKFSLPSIQLGGKNGIFYFENISSYLNYNYKHPVPAPAADDTALNRDRTYNKFDTTNKLSLPAKIAFLKLTPFISGQDTYYDKNATYGSTMHVNFSTGSDLSTKFYRLFNVKTNFLGLNIHNLRHIVTPTIAYTYSHTSVMPATKARFGGGATTTNSSATLNLFNKLQTKQQGKSKDLADLRVNSTYYFNPKTGDRLGSYLSDILLNLELRPYSWLTFTFDSTYKRSGNDNDANYNYKHFSNANYNFNFNFGKDRTIGLGQRYQRKGGNEITLGIDWRLSPKWKSSFYQRHNRGHDPTLKRGLREQEYSLVRDLHCWEVKLTYNVRRGFGEGIWLVFKLKAFPELEFEYGQQYHAPKPGTQSNP